MRREAKKAMLEEARGQEAFARLIGVPGLGPIRVAQLLAQVGSPHRFNSKRQFWTYCGLSVVTHSSSDWEMRDGKLERRAKSRQTRGLTRDYSRRLKLIFKSAALEALKVEHIKRIYTRLVENGTRPELARLTIARKLAAVALRVWKSGEGYEASKLTKAA